MAEFQEVMLKWHRMCEKDKCNDCHILRAGLPCDPMCIQGDEIHLIESIIMEWAAEHPEPRYPTWEEWYKSNFPNVGHPVCPNYFLKNTCDLYKSCDECRSQPIPADIAQKLGIKLITEERVNK